MDKVAEEKVVKSTCNMCNRMCGVLVYLRDGKVTKVDGDPECPANWGVLCVRGHAAVETLYHPARLKYPMKRTGARGEGKWQRISWDEALETIAEAMNNAKAKYGAESVSFVAGFARPFWPYVQRLQNVFGSPNFTTAGHVCSVPRRLGAVITYGQSPTTGPDQSQDLDFPPAAVLMWGINTAISDIPAYVRLERAFSKGTRLVVIDSRKTYYAARADLWLQPRPASDMALALAMINYIINEELYDKEFVAKWTHGFDELRQHVQQYTTKWAEEITWVPEEKIKAAARMYATIKPAALRDGNAFDENRNSVQTSRCISILRGLTGNLGVPGGDLDWSPLPVLKGPKFTLADKLPEEQRKKRIGYDWGFSPLPPARLTLPQLLVKAILKEEPYPVKVLCIHAANPLITWSNSKEAYEALMKVDFSYVADPVMTPSAELADIVLPVGTYLEIDDVAYRSPYLQLRQKVAQIGEAKSDHEIVNELAKKVGLGEYFWDDISKAYDELLEPAGLTFEELKKIGGMMAKREYRKHEKTGFDTPTGKVEFYSTLMKDWGHEPLPVYHEPPETPFSAPELAKEYPLVFTNWHNRAYTHSDNRHIASLRGLEPEPVAEIHPETAKGLGIEDGDMVYIENKRGRIKQRAKLTDGIDPRVVGVNYAWWFPEQGIETLHGWQESNINILTPSEPPYDPEIGSTNLRGLLCRVYKVP
jgi:anaerobic selenocysteine-containing dehydrogenase